MIVLLDRAPLYDEAVRLVESGATDVRFPFVDEGMVAEHHHSLWLAREVLERAGVAVGVRGDLS